MRLRSWIGSLTLAALVSVFPTVSAFAADAKIVLLAGTPSHGPGEHEFNAGITILDSLLKQNKGVTTVVVRGGWPTDESVFDNARALVFYMDGGAKHPIIQGDHLEKIGKMMSKGVGMLCLHYAVEVPAERGGKEFLDWIGGYYETNFSHNPINDVKVHQASPKHPVSRGWTDFETRDEWYYSIRFNPEDKTVTPILTAMLPPESPTLQTTAWAKQRPDGGRGFGCTGAHFHKNWGNADFRRMLTNAVLWVAKVDVPKQGAKVELPEQDLTSGLDPKPPKT